MFLTVVLSCPIVALYMHNFEKLCSIRFETCMMHAVGSSFIFVKPGSHWHHNNKTARSHKCKTNTFMFEKHYITIHCSSDLNYHADTGLGSGSLYLQYYIMLQIYIIESFFLIHK